MWSMFLIAMMILSGLFSRIMEEGVIFVPIMFTVAGIVMSGFIWNWGQLPDTASQDRASEDLKRNRLTQALRNLSDDELHRLRQRLASGDVDDDQLARLLDESEASKAKRA
jgi:hypothetical protein